MGKKMIPLLLLFFIVINIQDVYATSTGGGGASFYNCDCEGKGINYTYYQCDKRVYYNCILLHEFDTSGGVIDRHYSLSLSTPDDMCYWIVQVKIGSDGKKTVLPTRLIISADQTFTTYQDHNGTVKSYNYSQYSAGSRGSCNDMYYVIDSYQLMILNESTDNGFEVLWADKWDYIIESNDTYTDLIELANWLCGGEDVKIPDSVTIITPPPVNDLEPPLNVKVNTSSATLNVSKDKIATSGNATLIPYKIWWNQSNIDLTGYVTEFYVKEFGRCRKGIFSKWEDCQTGWIFDNEYVTAKYCNNNLKWHEYRIWESVNLESVAKIQLNDESPNYEISSCNFMLRNKKEDENGQLHYSNWVYINCYPDGTYSIYEMNKDYNIDEDSDETGNVNVDSEIYDDEVIHTDNTDVSIDVGGVSQSGSFITILKDLANSLKTFPDFFAQVFSFLPSWVLTCIGTLFVIILLCAIF